MPLEGYQGGRRFDAELIDQLEMLPEFVAACGFACAKAAGYEAERLPRGAWPWLTRRGAAAPS